MTYTDLKRLRHLAVKAQQDALSPAQLREYERLVSEWYADEDLKARTHYPYFT